MTADPKQVSFLDRVPLRHGEVFRPDRSRLLPAGCHFNPSIAIQGDRLWMVYRRVTPEDERAVETWPRRLALCRLGADLQAEPGSNVDLSDRIEDPPGAHRWHADSRCFFHRDELWISYHDNFDLFVLPLEPERLPERLSPRPLELVGRKRRERERNWGLFDDGAFKAVYTIAPHVVLQLDETAPTLRAGPLHETEVEIPWNVERWGEPHGGTSPVRVGSCWFSFFQSSARAKADSLQKIYRVGFYGFDAAPPHRIRYMTPRPILEGDAFEGPLSFWQDYAVAYPSGAVYRDGRWLVSLGIHDRSLGFSLFEHERLIASCVGL